MTLAERLAAEALPCLQVEYASDGTCSTVEYLSPCPHCERRPAVEAAIRKAISKCEVIADMDADACCYSCEQIRKEIALLLTEETP